MSALKCQSRSSAAATATLLGAPYLPKRKRSGFSLVELLVVIGIIAVLISLLLPALNKARQSAALVGCQSNLRQIGQAILLYGQESHGKAPWGRVQYKPDPAGGATWVSNGQDYGWIDCLSVTLGVKLNGTTQNVATAAKCFNDYDTNPQNPNIYGVPQYRNHYQGNIRFFGETYPNPTDQKFIRPHSLKISDSSNVAIVWDGAQVLVNWGTGSAENVSEPIDNFQFNFGHGYSYPNPLDSWYGTTHYNDPVAIGGGTGVVGSPSVIPAMQVKLNTDNYTWGSLRPAIRFRHLSNSTSNFLFADGHVEPRHLTAAGATDLKLRDICMNR